MLGSDTMVLNKRGQALIEFVLLLPIIIILIFSSIDVLNLVLRKNDLNTRVNDEIVLFENKKETITDLEQRLESEGIDVTFKQEDKYVTVIATQEIKWISPVTTTILKNYTIKTKRVISFE